MSFKSLSSRRCHGPWARGFRGDDWVGKEAQSDRDTISCMLLTLKTMGLSTERLHAQHQRPPITDTGQRCCSYDTHTQPTPEEYLV